MQRNKLTDVVRDRNLVFSQSVSGFGEAYPTVDKLKVKIIEKDVSRPDKAPIYMTESNFRHALNCSNPICHGGGAEIGWILHSMVSKGETEHRERIRCVGHEGTKTKRYRDCLISFDIQMHVTYKSGQPIESNPSSTPEES